MGGSNIPQAFPNYLICLCFRYRISMVVERSETNLHTINIIVVADKAGCCGCMESAATSRERDTQIN